MFGRIRRKREKKRAKKRKEEQAMQREASKIEQQTHLPSNQEIQEIQNRTNEVANQETQRQKEAREGHKAEAKEDVTTEMPGLTPQQRQAMQESANMQIGGHLDNYSKMLASSQGARGVRGGKAQADLRRQALNAQNQVTRDLNEKDADLAMQRLAAYLSSLEGKQAADILNRQQAQDLLLGQQEKKKNSAYNTYYNKYFSKV